MKKDSSAYHEFSRRLIETVYTSKTEMELFVEGRNFIEEIISECYQKLIPLGNHRSRITTKINELRGIGFLDESYANNCKKIYDIGTIYTHQKIVDGKIMTRSEKDKKSKKLCMLFLGTPSSKLLNDMKRTMIEKYAEAIINTLQEMKRAITQGRNTQSLGKISSKSATRKALKKK